MWCFEKCWLQVEYFETVSRWPMLEMSCTWKLGPTRPLQLNNVCTIVPRITQQCSVSSNTSRITFKPMVLRDMAGTFLNPVGRKHMLTLERHLVPAPDIADDGWAGAKAPELFGPSEAPRGPGSGCRNAQVPPRQEGPHLAHQVPTPSRGPPQGAPPGT